MPNELALVNDTLLALPEEMKDKLQTKEDCKSFLTQIKSVGQSISWLEADTYLWILDHFGDTTVNEIAVSFGVPNKTIYNYIRTSRAFPAPKRLSGASFSHHLEAAFEDKYNENTGEFEGDKRFGWVEKAQDENYSTKRLREEMRQEKEKEEKGVEILPCDKCGGSDGEIHRCVLYVFGKRNEPHRWNLHTDCLAGLIAFATKKD